MSQPRPVQPPHSPPPDSSFIEKILWILMNPDSWLPLLEQYWITILMIVLFIVILIYILQWLSEYYILKKVYLKGDKDKRMPRYIGRQILFLKKSTPLLGRFAPKTDEIKGILIVKDAESKLQFWKGRTLKIFIPKHVKFKEKSNRTTIFKPDIKYDYSKFHAYIPTSETFEAISESEQTFYELIKEKIDETDSKVQKAINCNPEIVKDQKKSGSIPLSAEQSQKPTNRGKIMEEISIEDNEDMDYQSDSVRTDDSLSLEERKQRVMERMGGKS